VAALPANEGALTRGFGLTLGVFVVVDDLGDQVPKGSALKAVRS